MGKIIVLVGPSASGKTTIKQMLNLPKITTSTSRPIREGEINGKDYFFLTKEQFEEGIQNEYFAEHEKYVRHYYGTSKEMIEIAVASENDYVSVMEINGALKLKAMFPYHVVVIAITVPVDVMTKRLQERPGITDQEINERIEQSLEDMKQYQNADVQIENIDLEDTIFAIKNIVRY